MKPRIADVCLLLEGTYPHTPGGVSSWVHDLVTGMGDLTFHVVSILSGSTVPAPHYTPPANVIARSPLFVRTLKPGKKPGRALDRIFDQIEGPLLRLQEGSGGLEEIVSINSALKPYRGSIGENALLNSKAAWRLLHLMYGHSHAGCSFLDYFWTWRCLQEGLFSMMVADLPAARCYHTVCTGYAGLLAARASSETGRPVILTEHGIYTNERRVEIAMADWLTERPPPSLDPTLQHRTLGDVWTRSFESYSRACYAACNPVITLYEGNQMFQRADGASPDRMRVIPNGVDPDRFPAGRRREIPHRPTIALIGRVVPIKDVMTYIRACAILARDVPDLRAWVLGPDGEDPAYAEECRAMSGHLGLGAVLEFKGQVRLEEYLHEVDILVLTSISEAQPLVILEAGAAGIPSVATDVGSCRELLLGRPGETPALGPGGVITPLANPASTARALAGLLGDPDRLAACGETMRRRVRRHYNKREILACYHDLYRAAADRPDRAVSPEGLPWPA
ncbi:MAG: GT4 family glycosyltransferase PelF [Kiritimatiellia bacterium]